MKYISAFADRIYSSGGYYDETVPISERFDISVLEPSPISYVCDVYPPQRYPKVPFSLFGPEEEFLQSLSTRFGWISSQFPGISGSSAVALESCFMHKNVIYRPADEGLDVIHETYRNNDRDWTSPLDFTNPSPTVTRTFTDKSRKYLYLGSVGSSNYGHWLVDDLGRSKVLGMTEGPFTIVLTSYGKAIDKVRKQSLELLWPGDRDLRWEWITSTDTVYFDQLTYVTPISFHPCAKSPKALEFIRSSSGSAIVQHGEKCRRVFVKRGPDRYRRLTNTVDIETYLASQGFISTDPECLPYDEQVRLFSQAEVIVGVMCAAMVNTVFSQPGAHVIYLAPSGWKEPFYWDLASALNHRYSAVYGTLAGRDQTAHMDDFSIQLDYLREALQAAGALD